MDKKIQWLKWEDPLIPKKDEHDLETKYHKDSFKEFEEADDRHVRLVLGPYGLIPLNENAITAKLYKLWVGHCNFDITDSIKEKIEKVNGVEVLRVWTRYRFWLGIGNLFNDYEVQSDIENSILNKNKIKNKNTALNALIKVMKKKYVAWVIYSDENGELKTVGSDDIENLKKQMEFKNKIDILACSWDNN